MLLLTGNIKILRKKLTLKLKRESSLFFWNGFLLAVENIFDTVKSFVLLVTVYFISFQIISNIHRESLLQTGWFVSC